MFIYKVLPFLRKILLPEAVTDRDKNMTQSLMDQISCKSNARQNIEGKKVAFSFVTVTELGVEFSHKS